MTAPLSCSFKIFIILVIIDRSLFIVIYSIPLKVETITDIKEVTACLNELFLILRMSLIILC